MYRWLAALLLLPASLKVYRTPRAWLKALAAGPNCFFSTVIKTAPQHIRRVPSRWRNILVYWPMKVGIDLIHSRSTKATLRRAWRWLKKGGSGGHSPAPELPLPGTDRACPGPMPSEHICALIRQPGIQVVSFDIFDTLLERPTLHPKDIFYVVAAKVDAALGVDFLKMRWNAEEETGKINATIDDIYAHIQKKYQLDAHTATTLQAEEIRCEATLLAPRADIKACYDEAVKLGKRIIAVSDMYLPADVLRSFLQGKGYDQVAAVYVSCDYGSRKSDGLLYDRVIAAEAVHPSEILHMGDNRQSDYLSALSRGISAVYTPAPLEQLLDGSPDFAALLDAAARREPFWNLVLGFGLRRLCAEQGPCPTPVGRVEDLGRFAALTFAPLLTGYCLSLAGDTKLQQDYTQIHFASRDGYLPHKIYSILARQVPCLPAVYFYAGRRAYYPFLHDSFWDYAATMQAAGINNCTLLDFVEGHFVDSELLELLSTNLSDEEKTLCFFSEQKRCLDILRRFASAIDDHMAQKRAGIRQYYSTVFPAEEKRHLVFDIGYSGSIGTALTAITGKPVDKLYFWATPANKQCDTTLGSTTRLFMRAEGFVPYNLLFEEAFSPCEGGVTDFDHQGKPVFEPFTAHEAFTEGMASIHQVCLTFAEEFCARFGQYTGCVRPASGDAIMDICRFLLTETPFCNSGLFRDIVFPDPIHHVGTPSLEHKIERFLPHKTVFAGTGFDDPRHLVRPAPRLPEVPFKLGMHVHLHNLALSDEILRYLRDFPAPLDLYVTLTDPSAVRTVGNLFSPACIPQAKKVQVLPVANRGRDIAPWVLGMRPYQSEYDLFCHVHAKESPHFDFGDAWRHYLFDNLIRQDAVESILDLFQQRPRLGCVFPPAFPQLKALMTAHDIPPSGLKGECQMACELLKRMGLRGELCRTELLFSVGSMLWYRPQALRQLFAFDLRLEEFPEEPIGVEGTAAHAIERLPALLVARNAYDVGMFAQRA